MAEEIITIEITVTRHIKGEQEVASESRELDPEVIKFIERKGGTLTAASAAAALKDACRRADAGEPHIPHGLGG